MIDGERVRPPSVWALAGWGALWGCALGFVGLARPIIVAHHAQFSGLGEWLIVEVALASFFASYGAILGATILLLVRDGLAVAKRRARNPQWAAGLAAGPSVAIGYVIVAVILLWNQISIQTIEVARSDFNSILLYAGTLAGLTVWSLLMYGQIVTRERHLPIAALATALAVVTVVAGGALPLTTRAPGTRRAEPGVSVPLKASSDDGRSRAPLLFVGIDAANWQPLTALLQQSKLPAFESMLSHGMHGETVAQWPPYYSSPAWAAIVTGYPLDDTGIYENLCLDAPGLPPLQMPFLPDYWLNPFYGWRRMLNSAGLVRIEQQPREALRRPPFWELLTQAGLETAVVRFRFTFPPAGRSTFVVSDFVGRDHWEAVGTQREFASGIEAPAAEKQKLLTDFDSGPDELDRRLRMFFSPQNLSPSSADRRGNLQLLKDAFRIDEETANAAEHLLAAHPELSTLAVYFGGFDTICHLFWKYRFPNQFPGVLRPVDVAELGSVVDNYAIYLDSVVSRLTRAYRTDPNVVVLSDHGFATDFHDSHGLFLAAGPDLPAAAGSLNVPYVDVVPTVLQLTGFDKPPGLSGTSLLTNGRH